MSITIFEACIEKITRVTNDSKDVRNRGGGSLPKSIRIQIHEDSGDASLVAYHGHENILNARVNAIPSLVHGENDRVVVAQLFDAAFYKDGIFRRFYLYFSDRCDAQKFCKLYNRESAMVRTIKKLKDSLLEHPKTSKPDASGCDCKGERKGLAASSSSFSNEDVDPTSGEDSESNSISDYCERNHNSDNVNDKKSCVGPWYEDVDDLLGGCEFNDNTQVWPQEPMKPFGNF